MQPGKLIDSRNLIPYQTVNGYSEIRLEISRSVFIGYAMRIELEEAAVDFIQRMKKTNSGATHNCSAYVVGRQPELQKSDDDGEPSGTAGKPILEVIKKQGLTDTVVVVTRYFGGIKLGAGGLIRAYGKAASEAIRAAGVVRLQPYLRMKVTCDYSLMAVLENNLRQQGYTLAEKDFAERVTIYVLRSPDDPNFEQQIADWSGGTAVIQTVGETYVETALEQIS